MRRKELSHINNHVIGTITTPYSADPTVALREQRGVMTNHDSHWVDMAFIMPDIQRHPVWWDSCVLDLDYIQNQTSKITANTSTVILGFNGFQLKTQLIPTVVTLLSFFLFKIFALGIVKNKCIQIVAT